MKKIILTITCMLITGFATAQNATYAPTAKKYTSAELNTTTTEIYIGLKNLSNTNNYWYYGEVKLC